MIITQRDQSMWHTWQLSLFLLKTTKNWQFSGFQRTDSTKINRPGHSIRMYLTKIRKPNAQVQRNIFGKTLIEACSSHLYASFGTFYATIGQL